MLKIMEFRKLVTAVLLSALMLSMLVLVQPALATPKLVDSQDITVQQAYDMIKHQSTRGSIIILDVRNENEYNLNHLYGAISIPLDELEIRTNELDMDAKIIVYCGSGGRSAIASKILTDQGFDGVYNMIGGITAWIQAEYPAYITSHNVAVDTTGENGVNIEMEPLLMLTDCVLCKTSQGCQDASEITNIQITPLYEGADYTVTMVTYELNGTLLEFTITESVLWHYSNNTNGVSEAANFSMITITSNVASLQYYSLDYLLQHAEYNFTIATNLTPLDAKTYNSSVTIVNFVPVEASKILSLDLAEINSTVTLSQLYNTLDEVATKIGQAYIKEGQKNNEAKLEQLGQNYQLMATELSRFSRIVQEQLPQYDKEILNNLAVLIDPEPECTLCQVALPLLTMGCIGICFLFPPICAYCATLVYYYLVLEFSAAIACAAAGLCP
ncbi:MAG: rhodanese-like domain-containing protein [Candidatus Bathyarchaeia archaeon]|jgi:rhodanese-related sulfurtransferase